MYTYVCKHKKITALDEHNLNIGHARLDDAAMQYVASAVLRYRTHNGYGAVLHYPSGSSFVPLDGCSHDNPEE